MKIDYEPTWLESCPDWHFRAACRGLDWRLFFLDEEDEVLAHRSKCPPEKDLPGLVICQTCPVVDQCLDEALADPKLDVGIRGGMTGLARKRLRSRRRGLATQRTSSRRSSG